MLEVAMSSEVYSFAYSNGPKSVAWSRSLVPAQSQAFTIRPVSGNQAQTAASSSESQVSTQIDIRQGVVANVFV